MSAPKKRRDERGGDRHAYRAYRARPLDDEQEARWEAAIAASTLGPTEWVRRALDAAAERENATFSRGGKKK